MAYERHVWEPKEPITRDKLNHMEEGIEGAYEGGGVQSDFNQDDDTALDYIKNRPYIRETTTRTEVLLDEECEFSNWDNVCGAWLDFEYMVTVSPSDTLSVTYDGVTYDNLKIKWYNPSVVERSSSLKGYVGATIVSDSVIDWSEYPFTIIIGHSDSDIPQPVSVDYMQAIIQIDSGYNHYIKLEHSATVSNMEISQGFRDAVNAVLSSPLEVDCEFVDNRNSFQLLSHSINEIMDYCNNHNSIMWVDVSIGDPASILYVTSKHWVNGILSEIVLGSNSGDRLMGLTFNTYNPTAIYTFFRANGTINQYTYSILDKETNNVPVIVEQ